MRSDLGDVAGVLDIRTDTSNLSCQFVFMPGETDIEAKLAELATTNEHIAGYSIVSGLN